MQWQPHNYQVRAGKFALAHNSAALFLDMGLGKTSIMLTVALRLRQAGTVRGVLVVAPLRVIHNVWRQEAEKWDHLADLRFSILHGPEKDLRLLNEADIYLINYDGLTWLYESLKKRKNGNKVPFNVLILDESSQIKNPSTQRWKRLKAMLPLFIRKYLLTATPTPQSYLDIWTQVYAMDRGEALGTAFSRFRNQYFEPADYMGYKMRPRAGAEQVIDKKIAPMCLRMSAAEYLELPERIEVTHSIELPADIREMYHDMEKDFFIQLDSGVVQAANAAVSSIKLRQICQGVIIPSEGRAPVWVHREKIETLLELIEQIDEPVIVAIQFRAEAFELMKCLPEAGLIMGGVSSVEGARIINTWNSGKLRVLIAHPASLAHGVNLQHGGRRLIWLAPTWSLEQNDQFEGRIRRQGQRDTVFIHRIEAKNTVDQVVVAALRDKGDGQARLLAAIRKYREGKEENES